MDIDQELKKYDELMEWLWNAEETITRLKEEVKNVRGTLALEKRLIDMSIKQQAEREQEDEFLRAMREVLREMREEQRDFQRRAALAKAIEEIDREMDRRTLS